MADDGVSVMTDDGVNVMTDDEKKVGQHFDMNV